MAVSPVNFAKANFLASVSTANVAGLRAKVKVRTSFGVGKADTGVGKLFRKDAVLHRESRLDGEVLMAQPLSASVLVFFLVSVVGISILFLASGDYARRTHAVGYLRTDAGVENLSASISGRIERLHAREGQYVFPGDVLGGIVAENHGTDGLTAFQALMDANQKKLALLKEQVELHEKAFEDSARRLKASSRAEAAKLTILRDENRVLSERRDLEQEQLLAVKGLMEQGALSRSTFIKSRQRLLEYQQSVIASKLSLDNQVKLVEEQRDAQARLPVTFAQEKNRLQRLIVELEEEHTRLLRRYNQLIVTKTGGIVSNLTARLGDRVSVGDPLMQIIPAHAELHAELLVPAEAAGMIMPGQEVQLRYAAFPHQRFGIATGRLTEISRSIHLQKDIPVGGKRSPGYIARASLPAQSVAAYGQQYPLKPGMLLEADIILDKRPLIQWLLDPVFSIRGKLQ